MFTNLTKQKLDPSKKKKTPPPRPPPPKFSKPPNDTCLIEWSPPGSPKPICGSAASSYNSSNSSIASSKKSFDMEPVDNWLTKTNHLHNSTFYVKQNGAACGTIMPTIIRAQQPKKRVREPSPLRVMPPSIPPPSPPKESADIITPFGIALFEFVPCQEGDLLLQENDVVILLRRVNSDWLYGAVGDREGMFPANFVDVQVPLPEDKDLVSVLYDFRAQMPGDLDLRAGQMVKVIKKLSNDWWYGECNNQRGQFPANYVNRII